MQRLSGADAAFIYLETPRSHMHVAMTGIYDVSTMPGGYDFDRIRDLMIERSRLIPPFRRRLVEVPLRLNHPIWVEDPHFDIDFHLRRVAVPAPGGRRELAEMAGQIASTPLDRSRPLWEAWIIEELKQDRIGFVCKVHHSAIDGVSGADIMTVLYDLTPEGRDLSSDAPEIDTRVPSDIELIGHALRSRVKRWAGAPALVGRTVQSVSQVISNRLSEDKGHGAVPLTAPHTPFNGPISRHRRVSFARIPLSDAKFVKNVFGVKLNDVVLAVVSGTLRHYLELHNGLPDESLIACCPISVRTESEHGDYNNRVSAMFTDLASNIEDPVGRLMTIAQSTEGAKEEHNAIGADMLTDWTEWAAPRTFGLAARLYSELGLSARHRPIHNLVISNVPGPPVPLYFAGAKLVAAYPMGPIMDGAGLNATVLSYEDNIDFGFMVDRDLIPDPWELAAAVAPAFAALKEAADKRFAQTEAAREASEAQLRESTAKRAKARKAKSTDAGDTATSATAPAAPAKKAAAKKAPAKKAPAKKAAAKKAPAKAAAAKKAPAKKAVTTTAKKAAGTTATAAKATAKRAPATKAPAAAAAAKKTSVTPTQAASAPEATPAKPSPAVGGSAATTAPATTASTPEAAS